MKRVKCIIEGTETKLTINCSESFNDFSTQLQLQKQFKQVKCQNFLAYYANKGKSGEKTLVSTEDHFKSYLQMATRYNTLPLTLKLILEEESADNTLLDQSNPLRLDDNPNIGSNNLKPLKTMVQEENEEEDIKIENDGKTLPSKFSKKEYAAESGEEEEEKNSTEIPVKEKEGKKEMENNLKQNFSIKDNTAQSEEEEEVDNNNRLKQKFSIKDNTAQSEEEEEVDNSNKLKQNFSIKNNTSQSGEDEKLDISDQLKQKFSIKDNTAQSEEEEEVDNSNQLKQKFSIKDNTAQSEEEEEVDDSNQLKPKFSIKDNTAQSEEEEEVENSNQLKQKFSIRDTTAQSEEEVENSVQSEKEEKVENKNTIEKETEFKNKFSNKNPPEFFDEERKIGKKEESKKNDFSPNVKRDISTFDQVNNLLKNKKIRVQFKDSWLDIKSISSYFSFKKNISEHFNVPIFKAIYKNPETKQIFPISSETDFENFLKFFLHHGKKFSKAIELQITEKKEIEQINHDLLGCSKPLNEESSGQNLKPLNSIIFENEKDFPRSNITQKELNIDCKEISQNQQNAIKDFVEEFLKKELKEIMHKTYLPMIFEKTDLICKEKFLELFYKQSVDFSSKSKRQDLKCDDCEKSPIFGERYKCLICKEHNLCFECEKAYSDDSHVFAKIKNANQEELFAKIIRKDFPN